MATPDRFAGPTAVRWGAVIAGAVIGFAIMVLLSALWVAWGEGAGVNAIADNLHWFAFASAVVALFIADLIAGGLSGMPGAGTGLLQGVTVWGSVLVVATVLPIPQALQLFETFTTPLPDYVEPEDATPHRGQLDRMSIEKEGSNGPNRWTVLDSTQRLSSTPPYEELRISRQPASRMF